MRLKLGVAYREEELLGSGLLACNSVVLLTFSVFSWRFRKGSFLNKSGNLNSSLHILFSSFQMRTFGSVSLMISCSYCKYTQAASARCGRWFRVHVCLLRIFGSKLILVPDIPLILPVTFSCAPPPMKQERKFSTLRFQRERNFIFI